MVEKIKPTSEIHESFRDDGRGPRTVSLIFYCPTCGRYIGSWKKEVACDKCGTFYDWGEKEPKIKTVTIID